jgi:hypothetical protein
MNWNLREVRTFSYHFHEVECKRGDVIKQYDEYLDNLYFVIEGEFFLRYKVVN